MIGFIIGFFVGGMFGFLIAAVLSMAKDFDKRGRSDDQDRG